MQIILISATFPAFENTPHPNIQAKTSTPPFWIISYAIMGRPCKELLYMHRESPLQKVSTSQLGHCIVQMPHTTHFPLLLSCHSVSMKGGSQHGPLWLETSHMQYKTPPLHNRPPIQNVQTPFPPDMHKGDGECRRCNKTFYM